MYKAHYAFALGYKAGLTGEEQTVALSAELQKYYDVGYEQGFADDAFGEVNVDVFRT